MAHDDQQVLLDKLTAAKQKIDVGQRYFHYKSPDKFYTIKEIALMEETQEIVVVYEAEYCPGLVWVRSLEKFLNQVEVDGQTVSRFTRID